jgi:acyl-CoA synthetase (AMP-forming)/AMP-acid ligase II
MSLIERIVIGLAQPDMTMSWDLGAPVPGSHVLADVENLADAIASAELEGRPVSIQVPSSPIAVALHLACLATGTTVQHMPVSFGRVEVAGVLDSVRPALFITTRQDVAEAVEIDSPDTRVVLISDDDLPSAERVAGLVARHHGESVPIRTRARLVDDRVPALLLPTSGTTGPSKVVVHTQRTLEAATDLTARAIRMQADELFFSPSPPTHITGLLLGIYLPVIHGAGTAFQTRWDADKGLKIIQTRGCTLSSAIPTFVIDLHDAWTRVGGTFLRRYLIGGADVPTERITLIEDETGCLFLRSYGGTEAPMLTLASPDDSRALRLTADGTVLAPAEVITVDGPGTELRLRAPQQAVGYYLRGEIRPLADEEGWATLGDEGSVDADGVLRMSGRIKDVIVRGGVKFYVPELDAVIRSLDGVGDAAVFPVVDERLGQVPAVAIVPSPGHDVPTTDGLAKILLGLSFGPQKHPVSVMRVEAIPRTPTGKIDRRELARLYGLAKE